MGFWDKAKEIAEKCWGKTKEIAEKCWDGGRRASDALNYGLHPDVIADKVQAAKDDPVKGPQIEKAQGFLEFTGMPTGALTTGLGLSTHLQSFANFLDNLSDIEFARTVGAAAADAISNKKAARGFPSSW